MFVTHRLLNATSATDATMLHALAQGVAELHDLIKTDLSPASNAMPAMLDSLIARADQLANDLSVLEMVRGRQA